MNARYRLMHALPVVASAPVTTAFKRDQKLTCPPPFYHPASYRCSLPVAQP